MTIEKYGRVEVSDKGICISDFTFDCKGEGFTFETAKRRALYFARGVINRELELLESDFEDYVR